MDWGKTSLPKGRNVQGSPTASCSQKELGKKSGYISFTLSKATDLGLICLLSFNGTEISGSQEVIKIGEVTTIVVGEAPEEIFEHSGLPTPKRAAGFPSASCTFSTKGQCSWMEVVQNLAMVTGS